MSERGSLPVDEKLVVFWRVVVSGGLLIFVGASVGWYGLVGVRDFDFLMGMSGSRTIVLGTLIGLVYALYLWCYRLKRHVGWALGLVLASFVPTLAIAFYVFDSGKVFTTESLIVEVMPASNRLMEVLDSLSSEGRLPDDINELMRLRPDLADQLNGRYYGPEAYSWDGHTNRDGRFTGHIHVKGDPARNVPDWIIDATARPNINVDHSGLRKGLPIMDRERN